MPEVPPKENALLDEALKAPNYKLSGRYLKSKFVPQGPLKEFLILGVIPARFIFFGCIMFLHAYIRY